ncbi:hypothetical protein HL653_19025 [Sphingomonas sp. AP4-R1]|uniref:hypothetical protein n=1 Tax=Sphingomonas sp. AP4-R1 TaxID=2735134 RepID=UPI00149394B5|nr:hypothetical protein [Sphingomonas sp. AP4-R1]QJU59568.1 hypothetical protein HL653_19025 [Sphingomonas sp. AP4-R1]
MLQAVTTLISLFVGAIAIGVIITMLSEERDAIRMALGFAVPREPLAPLPPRFREISVRRGSSMRLAPPARVRVAL